MTDPRRIDGPTPNGGAYALAYAHDGGAVEIVEFDASGREIHRTYGPGEAASRVIYGTVRCRLFGAPAVVTLTDRGWSVPGEPILARAFDLLASPGDFGPAYGDPVACAVAKLAEVLGGTYELTPLPAMPAGTVY